MKNSIIYIGLFSLLLLGSCKKYEDSGFQDGPTVEDLLLDPSFDDLVLLSKGIEAQARVDLEFYIDNIGVIGREALDLNGSDPRYTGELLGANGGPLDPGGFLTTRSYAARYKTVLQANNVLLGLSNTSASMTSEERNGFMGFANTMKANALQMNLNTQYDNGIRIEVSDADNLGPFLSRSASQSAIIELLDLANSQLLAAGDAFPFTLGEGFASVGTPNGFAQFNRGLAAKANLYAGNNSAALTNISNSFMDLDGDLNMGGYLSFSESDVSNPLNHTDKYMAHPSFVSDAEAGDSRLSKAQLTDEITFDGLTSTYRANIYATPNDDASIMRNEELILIFAEASVNTSIVDALNGINTIRLGAGLGLYMGGESTSELMDEIATQRRYSLFGEGHRWIDMRRWDRLDELPIDRSGDIVHFQFPRPFGE